MKRPVKVSEGHMRGVEVLLTAPQGGDLRGTRYKGSCVCVCVLTASEKSNCASVCHFYKLLCYIPMSDVC